jgi:ribosomal protein S18 acetylase RimI-like enzyme
MLASWSRIERMNPQSRFTPNAIQLPHKLGNQTSISMDTLETQKAIASDFDFVYSLYRQTLYEYVEQTWGHPEKFQRNRMQDDFDTLPFEIFCRQGEQIGVISMVDEKTALRVKFLMILPTYQRQGFGKRMLRPVLEQAAERKIPVRLSVIRINPVKAFYENLGFKVIGHDEYCFFMEWQMS